MTIVVVGLTITSSWGNGHATTYRALVRALAARGHDVLFLERDVPWYAGHRDLPKPPYCGVALYGGTGDLESDHAADIAAADVVVVGSYVPDGITACDVVLRRARGCVAFYDIDTPVTLARLRERDRTDYIHRRQIPQFDLYLSFTGGPTLETLEREFGARLARELYCSVDPHAYRPIPGVPRRRDLSYLGTYSCDRQPALEGLLLDAARAWPEGRFAVAGPQYPESVGWPSNVEHLDHVAPGDHPRFYATSRFTLNVTRRDMIAAGYAPSVRLFEAAACGTPIISDRWRGLATIFEPHREILLADDTADVLSYVREIPESERRAIGNRARARVLMAHTSAHRACEFEQHVAEAACRRRSADVERGFVAGDEPRAPWPAGAAPGHVSSRIP
jgi:spore maturation protein CgeB